MSQRLHAFRERREALLAKYDALLELASDREFTAEELQESKDIDAKILELDTKIEMELNNIERRRSLPDNSADTQRPAEPPVDSG